MFLIGAPRSGTSLLYKCLALHPDLGYISNYNERLPRWESVSLLNRIPARLPTARRTVWFGGEGGNAYVYNGRRPLAHKLLPMPTEGESLFARCGLPEAAPPDDLPTPAAVAALRQTFGQVRRFGGGQRLLCKRIANNLRLPLLVEAFPDATFVLLTRDGRAVASSLRKVNWWPGFWVFWYGSTTDQWEADGGDPWELAARHWVEEVHAIESGLDGVPAGQRGLPGLRGLRGQPGRPSGRHRGPVRRWPPNGGLADRAAAPLVPRPQGVVAAPSSTRPHWPPSSRCSVTRCGATATRSGRRGRVFATLRRDAGSRP